MTHVSDQKKLLEAALLKQRVEIGLRERSGVDFLDDGLVAGRLELGKLLRQLSAGREDGRALGDLRVSSCTPLQLQEATDGCGKGVRRGWGRKLR